MGNALGGLHESRFSYAGHPADPREMSLSRIVRAGRGALLRLSDAEAGLHRWGSSAVAAAGWEPRNREDVKERGYKKQRGSLGMTAG